MLNAFGEPEDNLPSEDENQKNQIIAEWIYNLKTLSQNEEAIEQATTSLAEAITCQEISLFSVVLLEENCELSLFHALVIYQEYNFLEELFLKIQQEIDFKLIIEDFKKNNFLGTLDGKNYYSALHFAILKNDSDTTYFLLSAFPSLFKILSTDNQTPRELAEFLGLPELMCFLKNIDDNVTRGRLKLK